VPGSNCNNCSESMPSGARFCPACGQSVKEVSRPWTEFARETLAELADFDGRMLVSMRLLLMQPGFLTMEYIAGRRVSYTSPLRLYLVISLVFFLVLPLFLPAFSSTNPEHKLSVDIYSKSMFVLLPAFALLLKLFYRRVFFVNHLVFSVHLFSVMFIVFGLLLATESLADRFILVALVQAVFTFYVAAYFVGALHNVYQESWPRTILKFVTLLILFLMMVAITIEFTSHLE
jgi:hypothetical protein